MVKRGVMGAVLVVLALTGSGNAFASPANPDPFNPADCSANANPICDAGPFGLNSLTNPANPNSPLHPSNPANPNSLQNPMNPMNPMYDEDHDH